MTAYGHQAAMPGDECTNSASGRPRWTTPCCFADLAQEATQCPECNAPIYCTITLKPVAVCTIRTIEEDDQ